MQGVTHSNEFCFFTQETKLLKFHFSTDLDTNSNSAQSITHMPDDLSGKGYNHFGDPNLTYLGYRWLPNQTAAKETARAAWCAINRQHEM
ncbi:hypothetical protein [Robiginitalea sp.]|uniref:hypothetical protein n=1 Tax=Robiginitalea sp. TaxID=1902411 RepID=UPI003C721C41